MKKFIAAILAIIYLSTSMGATIHLHYCMDKLVSWSLRPEAANKKSCPFCGMPKTTPDKHCGKQAKGCCKDEQKQIKVQKDQKAAEAGFTLAKPLLQTADHLTCELPSFILTTPTLEYPTSHAPPRAENISLFIRNCNFRI